ncbi:MAG: hypothetical protein II846_00325 [Acetobacter sp.]|nr:hypothetical protein [Acetobacter sp.]
MTPSEKIIQFLSICFKRFFTFSNKEKDLDTLVDGFQKIILDSIKETEKQEQWIYRGGELKLLSGTDQNFSLQCVLYFQDSQEAWHEQALKKELSMRLLTQEAAKTLQEEKEIIYELDPNKEHSDSNTPHKSKEPSKQHMEQHPTENV